MKPIINHDVEIRPLTHLTGELALSVVTGYTSEFRYTLEKEESDAEFVIRGRLERLSEPHTASYREDFGSEDMSRFLDYLKHGLSFAAYRDDRLAGFAICERMDWNRVVRVWEFHVHPDCMRSGVGRMLMNHVAAVAQKNEYRALWLETQNTNVRAIRFYRSVGFEVETMHTAFYSNHDADPEPEREAAFFMIRKLE